MLLDRITGHRLLELPDQVYPGRYRALESTTLNRHSTLQAGDLLCSDGTDRCHLDDGTRPFMTLKAEAGPNAFQFTRAIQTIVRLQAGRQKKTKLLSPLLPAAMVSNQSHESELEQMLEEVLEDGHLYQISVQPRMDLKYEDDVTDVSRARRLTNRSLTHLASHSECWQRVTLNGVLPRKVLARFSEDDYNIYENRVYARLLDDLEIYLQRRLGEVEALHKNLDEAMNLTRDGSDLYFRLSDAIFTLWGDAEWSAEEMKTQIEATSKTAKKLAQHLNKIRALKRHGLYRKVPRSARVSSSLHWTNILTHDPHYRHVAQLWDTLCRERQNNSRKPSEILAGNQALEVQYSLYVGLVLQHALVRYGMGHGDSRVSWAGHIVSIEQSGLDWLLQVDGQTKIVLVPWACLHDLPSLDLPAQPRRVVCWPGIGVEDDVERAQPDPATLRLSPMDLYVVERMGSVLDSILAGFLLDHYAYPVKRVPSAVLAGASSMEGLKFSGNTLQILKPLRDSDEERLRQLLKDHAGDELTKEATSRLAEVKTLQYCPTCQEPVRLVPQQDDGFRGECDSCGCRRYWHSSAGGAWQYQQHIGEYRSFRSAGRRVLSMALVKRA